MKTLFGENLLNSKIYYDKKPSYCSTETASGTLKTFLEELEVVALLQYVFCFVLFCCFINNDIIIGVLEAVALLKKKSRVLSSTEAKSKKWRLFWSKLEVVTLLGLNLEHGGFSRTNWKQLFYWNQIWNVEVLEKLTKGCCFTEAKFEAWELFF
uniref:Uncharacterized protein n=1 Tax=Strongyloides stercoralis TaxID=6248 RepID=A0AAF5DK86_STRER